jgi:hypothetical protein
MKKQIILLTILCVITYQNAFAQWTVSSSNIYNTNTGNVGIGINPTNVAKLEVNGKLRVYGDIFTNNTLTFQDDARFPVTSANVPNLRAGYTTVSVPCFGIISPVTTGSADLWLSGNSGIRMFTGANANPAFTIHQNGNVGIGTTTPNAKLDVGAFLEGGLLGTVLGRLGEGNTAGDGTYLGVKGYETQLGIYNNKSFSIEHHFYGQTNSSINFFRGGSTTGGFITFNTDDNSEKMRINTNGNVSIGTTASDPTGALLTVKGSIHAKELLVDLDSPLADFVFDSDYKLMPLNQLEKYVNVNSHLPEMPSAEEVSKKGLSVGDMQNKLLQKIEELTLYTIQLKKEIDELKKK